LDTTLYWGARNACITSPAVIWAFFAVS
jgi:hypothetical protein